MLRKLAAALLSLLLCDPALAAFRAGALRAAPAVPKALMLPSIPSAGLPALGQLPGAGAVALPKSALPSAGLAAPVDPKPPAPAAAAVQLSAAAEPERKKGFDPVAALYDGRRGDGPEGAHHALDDKTVNDLELYAEGTGLYSLVNRTATAFGAQRLKWLLRHPSLDAAEIRGRQQAVRGLEKGSALRGEIDASFARLAGAAGPALAEHFREKRGAQRLLLIVTHLIQALLTGMAAILLPSAGLRALPQLAFMWAFMAGQPIANMQRARAELLAYKAAFEAARALSRSLARSDSPALRALAARLVVDGPAADPALAKAAGSLRRLQSQKAMLLPDVLWFHGAKTLPLLQKRLNAARAQIAQVLSALGELDVYRSLALYGEAHEGRASMPELLDGGPRIAIEDGHHPYLILKRKDGSVPNIARFSAGGGDPNFAVLTGSNMGGKSTYLKMIASLALLAQLGAPVPAAAMALTPLKLITSIDIRDNLASGKSLYDAETDRALALVRAADSGPGHLMVMDEILQGTNPEESSAAQWAIVRHLARTVNLFLLATHNPKVTRLEGAQDGVANFHVEERVEGGTMSFSHRILPGPAVSRNGIMTLEVKGFPPEIVEEARRELGR